MRPGQRYALLAGLAALSALLLSWSPVGRPVDHWVYDLLLRAFPPDASRSEALILAIDEETLDANGGVLGMREPLTRALKVLASHDPAVVAVDLVLSEARGAGDEDLARAIESVPPLVLAANLRASGDASWETPTAKLAEAASALGHVHAEPDEDGLCRRVLLAKAGGRTRLWAMGLEAFRLARGSGPIEETADDLTLGDVFVPASLRGGREFLLRFANPNSPIERLSLQRVLDDPSAAAVTRGRAVFIGVLVLGGIDRYLMTPYSFGTPMAGVEINATVYETLAGGDFLTPLSPTIALAATLLAAVALYLVFAHWSGSRAVWAGGVALAAVHLVPPLFFANGAVFPASQILFVGWIAFLVGVAWNYLGVRRSLDRAQEQTARYQKAVHFVTHEMRTPLTAIQGSSELITRYSLPKERQREIGRLIHKESERLARMVEMFLSVERLSAGELELRREPVDADALLADSVARIRPLAERKRIQVKHERSDDAWIDGDRELLDYACYNLLSNAVKYSPAETAISVRANRENGLTLVSVEDQGYGMDASEIRDIFKRFYRAKAARQSGEKGSGLGLAMVEEIVVGHGGEISVESEVGRGSRFTLKLPGAPAPAAAGENA